MYSSVGRTPLYINAVRAYFKPDDLIGTERKDVADPIVGAWFRIEKGPESTPPTYEYDEFGVVIDGIQIFMRVYTGNLLIGVYRRIQLPRRDGKINHSEGRRCVLLHQGKHNYIFFRQLWACSEVSD